MLLNVSRASSLPQGGVQDPLHLKGWLLASVAVFPSLSKNSFRHKRLAKSSMSACISDQLMRCGVGTKVNPRENSLILVSESCTLERFIPVSSGCWLEVSKLLYVTVISYFLHSFSCSPRRRFVFQTEISGKYTVLVLISILFYFFSSLRRGDQSTVFCIASGDSSSIETLYCLNNACPRKIPGWVVLVREMFSVKTVNSGLNIIIK